MEQVQLLKEQTNAGEIKETYSGNDNKKIVDYAELPGTPFTMVRRQNGYFVTLGNQMVTPELNSEEEALTYLQLNMWNIMLQMITVVFSKMTAGEVMVNENIKEKEEE